MLSRCMTAVTDAGRYGIEGHAHLLSWTVRWFAFSRAAASIACPVEVLGMTLAGTPLVLMLVPVWELQALE